MARKDYAVGYLLLAVMGRSTLALAALLEAFTRRTKVMLHAVGGGVQPAPQLVASPTVPAVVEGEQLIIADSGGDAGDESSAALTQLLTGMGLPLADVQHIIKTVGLPTDEEFLQMLNLLSSTEVIRDVQQQLQQPQQSTAADTPSAHDAAVETEPTAESTTDLGSSTSSSDGDGSGTHAVPELREHTRDVASSMDDPLMTRGIWSPVGSGGGRGWWFGGGGRGGGRGRGGWGNGGAGDDSEPYPPYHRTSCPPLALALALSIILPPPLIESMVLRLFRGLKALLFPAAPSPLGLPANTTAKLSRNGRSPLKDTPRSSSLVNQGGKRRLHFAEAAATEGEPVLMLWDGAGEGLTDGTPDPAGGEVLRLGDVQPARPADWWTQAQLQALRLRAAARDAPGGRTSGGSARDVASHVSALKAQLVESQEECARFAARGLAAAAVRAVIDAHDCTRHNTLPSDGSAAANGPGTLQHVLACLNDPLAAPTVMTPLSMPPITTAQDMQSSHVFPTPDDGCADVTVTAANDAVLPQAAHDLEAMWATRLLTTAAFGNVQQQSLMAALSEAQEAVRGLTAQQQTTDASMQEQVQLLEKRLHALHDEASDLAEHLKMSQQRIDDINAANASLEATVQAQDELLHVECSQSHQLAAQLEALRDTAAAELQRAKDHAAALSTHVLELQLATAAAADREAAAIAQGDQAVAALSAANHELADTERRASLLTTERDDLLAKLSHTTTALAASKSMAAAAQLEALAVPRLSQQRGELLSEVSRLTAALAAAQCDASATRSEEALDDSRPARERGALLQLNELTTALAAARADASAASRQVMEVESQRMSEREELKAQIDKLTAELSAAKSKAGAAQSCATVFQSEVQHASRRLAEGDERLSHLSRERDALQSQVSLLTAALALAQTGAQEVSRQTQASQDELLAQVGQLTAAVAAAEAQASAARAHASEVAEAAAAAGQHMTDQCHVLQAQLKEQTSLYEGRVSALTNDLAAATDVAALATLERHQAQRAANDHHSAAARAIAAADEAEKCADAAHVRRVVAVAMTRAAAAAEVAAAQDSAHREAMEQVNAATAAAAANVAEAHNAAAEAQARAHAALVVARALQQAWQQHLSAQQGQEERLAAAAPAMMARSGDVEARSESNPSQLQRQVVDMQRHLAALRMEASSIVAGLDAGLMVPSTFDLNHFTGAVSASWQQPSPRLRADLTQQGADAHTPMAARNATTPIKALYLEGLHGSPALSDTGSFLNMFLRPPSTAIHGAQQHGQYRQRDQEGRDERSTSVSPVLPMPRGPLGGGGSGSVTASMDLTNMASPLKPDLYGGAHGDHNAERAADEPMACGPLIAERMHELQGRLNTLLTYGGTHSPPATSREAGPLEQRLADRPVALGHAVGPGDDDVALGCAVGPGDDTAAHMDQAHAAGATADKVPSRRTTSDTKRAPRRTNEETTLGFMPSADSPTSSSCLPATTSRTTEPELVHTAGVAAAARHLSATQGINALDSDATLMPIDYPAEGDADAQLYTELAGGAGWLQPEALSEVALALQQLRRSVRSMSTGVLGTETTKKALMLRLQAAEAKLQAAGPGGGVDLAGGTSHRFLSGGGAGAAPRMSLSDANGFLQRSHRVSASDAGAVLRAHRISSSGVSESSFCSNANATSVASDASHLLDRERNDSSNGARRGPSALEVSDLLMPALDVSPRLPPAHATARRRSFMKSSSREGMGVHPAPSSSFALPVAKSSAAHPDAPLPPLGSSAGSASSMSSSLRRLASLPRNGDGISNKAGFTGSGHAPVDVTSGPSRFLRSASSSLTARAPPQLREHPTAPLVPQKAESSVSFAKKIGRLFSVAGANKAKSFSVRDE